MSAAPPPTGNHPSLTSQHIRVLGLVLNRDVTRDHTFVYRVLRRDTDVNDIVYELEDLHLVDLLPNGLVVATPAGELQRQQHQPQRRSPQLVTPQFTPAGVRPQA